MGLVLSMAGILSLLHATARAVALQANANMQPSKFTLARSLETAAFVLGVLLLAMATAWIFGTTRRGIVKVVVLMLVVTLVTHAAMRGSRPSALVWEVLTSRALSHFLRDPAPFVPVFIRGVDVLLRIALAGLALAARRRTASRVVFCLCLVSAGATDIPLLALALTVAALLSASVDDEPILSKPHASVS